MSKPKFILTVDTEFDRQSSDEISFENLRRLSKFQNFCSDMGIKVTYLCTYGAVTSPYFKDFLHSVNLSDLEIGAHLHPWSNPPFVDLDNSHKRFFPNNYDPSIIESKLKILTESICDRVTQPYSYRAGRFGFDVMQHTRILIKLGFKIDSSVTPGKIWKNNRNNDSVEVDYTNFDSSPFFLNSEGDISKNKYEENLFEIPVSNLSGISGKFSMLLRPLPTWYHYLRTRYLLSLRKNLKNKVIVMYMHSNELHEDYNPYFTSPKSVSNLYKNFRKLFMFLKDNGFEFNTLKTYFKSNYHD